MSVNNKELTLHRQVSDMACSCGRTFIDVGGCKSHVRGKNRTIARKQRRAENRERALYGLPPVVGRDRVRLGMKRDEFKSALLRALSRVGYSFDARLALLVEWAAAVIQKTEGDKLRVRRIDHWQRDREAIVGDCWVCAKRDTLIPHHVIQLQHGGSNQSWNLLYVCHPCHALVHPWLASEAPESSYAPPWWPAPSESVKQEDKWQAPTSKSPASGRRIPAWAKSGARN